MKESNELFKIVGISERAKIFFRKRNNITVYDSQIDIESYSERELIERDDIFNIYIQEPITMDVESRSVVIDYYEEGEESRYTLEDCVYPGLSYKMEEILSGEWKHIPEKKKQPAAVQWFNAACAVFYISAGYDPDIFGGMFVTPEATVENKKCLYDSWSIRNKGDADKYIMSLIEGRATKEYRVIRCLLDDDNLSLDEVQERTGVSDDLITRVASHDLRSDELRRLMKEVGRNSSHGLMAWDLVRAIHLTAASYICGYYTFESALDICLVAAVKLQQNFSSWNSMINDYLYGYSYWSDEDITDEDTEAYDRQQIFFKLQRMTSNPYRLDWNQNLIREW